MRRIKSHTSEKLEYIRKYINAYLHATKSIRIKYYIDAFAGTGKCVLCDEKCKSRGSQCNCGKGKIVDGSSLVALKSDLVFSKFFLIELGKKNITELEDVVKKEISIDRLSRTNFIIGNSNTKIPEIIKRFSGFASCLTLLDPEGPELDWDTISSLSKIKRMDILILFPYDMSLSRLAKDYKEKNDKFFGSEGWRSIHSTAPTISERKKRMLEYFLNNLKSLGFSQIRYKLIKSRYRSGNPLYHLILASRYPVAAKIMEDIFNKDLDNRIKLFKI